ncbi:MAG: multiheme c-type cytochrome, partial [Myxococcota bacterium]
MQREAHAGNGREALLGPFLAAHWRLPIAPQGEAPPDWPALERSLASADCGSCHPKQLAEWRGTLHAKAYSPGFAGQLLEGALAAPASLRGCQTCHAPLAEQQPVTASGAPNPSHAPALRDEGIVCAACHVREQRRFGPPRRAELPPLVGPLPHGGFEARSEYQESRFCAECHQFFDDEGVAGKPIQNTYVEWQQSPAAAEGKSCQGCHMPDRAHLWRGIHDPEMVRSGTETTLALEAAGQAAPERLAHHFACALEPARAA